MVAFRVSGYKVISRNAWQILWHSLETVCVQGIRLIHIKTLAQLLRPHLYRYAWGFRQNFSLQSFLVTVYLGVDVDVDVPATKIMFH